MAAEELTELAHPGDVPSLIRQLRKRLGLTQEQLAARIGVTFPTINRWENGRTTPSPLALRTIVELLHAMGDDGKDFLVKYFHDETRPGSR